MRVFVLFIIAGCLLGCGSTPHEESCAALLADADTETVLDGCLMMGIKVGVTDTSLLESGGICNQCGHDVTLNWRNDWLLHQGKTWREDGTIVEDAEWLRPQIAFYDVESDTVGLRQCGPTGEPAFSSTEEKSLTLAAGEAIFFEVDAPLEQALGFYKRDYSPQLYSAPTDTLLVTWPTASPRKFNNLPITYCGNAGLGSRAVPAFDPSADVENVFTETKSNLPLGPIE